MYPITVIDFLILFMLIQFKLLFGIVHYITFLEVAICSIQISPHTIMVLFLVKSRSKTSLIQSSLQESQILRSLDLLLFWGFFYLYPFVLCFFQRHSVFIPFIFYCWVLRSELTLLVIAIAFLAIRTSPSTTVNDFIVCCYDHNVTNDHKVFIHYIFYCWAVWHPGLSSLCL